MKLKKSTAQSNPSPFHSDRKLCFIDLETTGVSPLRDRIIEIGIVVIDGETIERYSTFVNPEVRLPPEITRITGITSQDLEFAPTFSEVVDRVEELTADALFIAHNARFDYAFLKHEFARLDRPFSRKTLCTVRLSRALFPGHPRYNLDAVTTFLGLSISDRHRALPDAEALVHIYEKAMVRDDFDNTVAKLLKKPTLPMQLSEEVLDSLPDTPGVYTFVDSEGTILYVGKSINIRTRVKSHFMSDYARTTDLAMSRQIQQVYAEETAGELGALIRESRMVKQMSPVYNRALRRSRQMIVALFARENTLPTITLAPLSEVPLESVENILACFKSQKQATEKLREIAREFKLCPKYLGLERGAGRCFASQLGACMGICDGMVDLEYHDRFTDGFQKLRVPPWPFPEATTLVEESERFRETHFIYKWCYMGSVIENKSTQEVSKNPYTHAFDWDEYKILARAIRARLTKKQGLSPINLTHIQEAFYL